MTYYRSSILNVLAGVSNMPSTLVHEFFHAIRGTTHDTDGAHSGMKFKIGDLTYNENFNKSAIIIWRNAIIGFRG